MLSLVPPYTIYFVAFVWVHNSLNGDIKLGTEAFAVSGVQPLTREEAVLRGKASQTAAENDIVWSDWHVGIGNVRWVTIGGPPE